MAQKIRENLNYCPDGDYAMSAVYCYQTMGLPQVNSQTWKEVLDILSTPLVTFADLPTVLQYKIFEMKHKLEMKTVTDDMKKAYTFSHATWKAINKCGSEVSLLTEHKKTIWRNIVTAHGFKSTPFIHTLDTVYPWYIRSNFLADVNPQTLYSRGLHLLHDLPVKELRSLCKSNNLRGGRTRKDLIVKLMSL
jgi:hypothetical protein